MKSLADFRNDYDWSTYPALDEMHAAIVRMDALVEQAFDALDIEGFRTRLVQCDKHHDWVRCDEAMICQRYLEDILMREAALIEFEQTLPELDEQFDAGFGAQVDAWLDAGLSYDEIE